MDNNTNSLVSISKNNALCYILIEYSQLQKLEIPDERLVKLGLGLSDSSIR